MNEMIKMVVVLTVMSVVSGGMLSALREKTAAQIKTQQLEFVKGPAIRQILAGSSNDPIKSLISIKDDQTERDIFVGNFDGKPNGVALESTGKGFGGEIGVMVGVNLENDQILGVRVTTHKETPGLGSKAKDDLAFVSQFKGLTLNQEFKVKADGGKVDAISGATVTSRGVSMALGEAQKIYQRLKNPIIEKAKSVK